MAKSDRYVVGRVENDIGSSQVGVLIPTCGTLRRSSGPVRLAPSAPLIASSSSSEQTHTEIESRNWNDGQV